MDERLAATLAAQCDTSVEVLSQRTESAQTFVEPDGGRRLVSSVAPQRLRRADGSWTAISANLVRQADGLLKPAATLADVTFSGGGSGPLVTWREAGQTFTLSSPLGKLPAPRVEGSTAVYESVLAGVNLHVTATEQGYTHAVELLTPAAAANPVVRALRYDTGGDLVVKNGGDGVLRLVDKAGRAVATSSPAQMWDSSTDPARAGEVRPEVAAAWAAGAARPVVEPATAVEPAVTSRTANVQVGVEGKQLTVIADAGMLADRTVTFPLFIDPFFEKQRAKWAYATNNGENNNNTAARVGLNDATGALYRSFFDFDVSALRGKKIVGVAARVTLDHSWSCTPTEVNAFRTGAITVASAGRMAWSTRPLPSGVWLDTWKGNANEAGGCGSVQPDTDAEFYSSYLTNDLQLAASSNWTTYTVGLCACSAGGGNESTQDRWKRFYPDKAWLEVEYDSVPATPSILTTSGQSCGATIGTSSPVFKAYYGDVDGAADSLTGYFEYQQTAPTIGGVVAVTGQTKAGNSYGESGTITLGAAAEGKTYQWRVKTKDAYGYESSPTWTAWCSFIVNVDAPPTPGVTGVLYKADGVARGGPGEADTFTFTADASDVVKYVYGWMGQAWTTVTVSPGAPYQVQLTPWRHGYNTLSVYSIDSAGKQSQTKHFQFLVGGPDAPIAHWPLDTIDAHHYGDTIGDADLTPNGSVSWAYDSRIIGEATASFADVGDEAVTSGPVVDTGRSFSVAAWVRPSEIDLVGDRNALGQDPAMTPGAQASGFYLGARRSGQGTHWSFQMHDTPDANSPSSPIFAGPTLSAADAGKWVHIAGVYDAAERKMRLYVNGVKAAEGDRAATPWAATGRFTVGRTFWGGAERWWLGEIADVRVWQRVIVPDDFWGTNADPAQGTQATAGILNPTEVAFWDFNGGTSAGCGSTVSATYWSQMLNLYGCTDPYSPQQTSGYTGDAHDNDALWLNQSQPDGYGSAGDGKGYAAASGPVLRTDQSFTVSAWVRPDNLNHNMTCISQRGTFESAFSLKLDAVSDRWQFYVADEDDTGTTYATVSSQSAASATSWTHLVGIYDANANQIRLYVNDVLQDTQNISFTPFMASQPLTVGYTRWQDQDVDHWMGGIDEVRLSQGAVPAPNVLTAGQILTTGQYLRSANGMYELVMQSDGNLVLYQAGSALWASGTDGNPGARAAMQHDGNFVIYTSGGTPIWHTVTWGTPADRLAVQDDGNLVLYGPGGQAFWDRW